MTPLDARASDPVALGWMAGSPPPHDKVVRFGDGSAFRFPQTRWSYSNMRQLVPTSVVSRGSAAVVELPRAERSDLDTLTFQPSGSADPMTWDQSLAANYTDGIIVLHRGTVVFERYFGALEAHTPHLAFSVTKSIVATVGAMLIAEGVVDEGAAVRSYLPELAQSGFADATIRDLMDMTTGINYSEDYTDATSGFWRLSEAGNFRPRPANYDGPDSFCEYLATLKQHHPHGQRFAYKTVNTDVLAWVLRRVTGETLSALVSERLWSRIGAEHDAYFTIDTTGVEFAGAGLNVTLRDLARLGEMMRLGGQCHGQQVVPLSVVDEIRRGGSQAQLSGAGYVLLQDWSYRRMWWVSHNEHGAYTARGIHGQALYVDPLAEMVVARLASHPQGANVHLDPTSLPAYHAVARRLME